MPNPTLSDAAVDRGDVVTPQSDAPPTAEEQRLAAELKAKEETDAKAKADADAKAKADADAKAKADATQEEEEDDPENPGKKRRDTRVPLARHKEILERERAEKERALARLAQYEGAKEIAKTNEEIKKAEDKLIELEGQHAKLITDNKPEEAAKVMGEIRKLERSINKANIDIETAAAESRAYERARYDVTVERVEAAYPVLNPDHDDYNAEKVRKVLSVARAYGNDGLTPSKALQEAVKDLLGDPETKKQEAAVETTPRVDEAAAKKAAREEEARRKAVEAAGKQPPDLGKTGVESDKLGSKGGLAAADVMKMPYKDFEKLSESDLALIRGDDGIPAPGARA